MICRRKLCLTLGVSAGLAPLAAHRSVRAQAVPTLRRVGLLTGGSQAIATPYVAAFKQGMADLGWHEGRNVQYHMGYANGDMTRFDALAREQLAQGVEVLLSGPNDATRAMHALAPALPIVMAFNGNVLGNGFVASLARPGGVITGLNINNEDMRGKPAELLLEMLPQVRRIAVLLGPRSDSTDATWADTQHACARLGLAAQRFSAANSAQLEDVIQQISRQRVDAVLVPVDSLLIAERVRLHTLLQAARLPAAYAVREHVVAGGLLSYGANINAQFRYAAKYVDKILKGAKPADLPVEQPMTYELVINLAGAKALGIQVPKALLLRADELIE